jgi:hypothetical protein
VEEAKALRQVARERAAEERKAKAAELAAARALKKQQRDATTPPKSRDTLKKGKRKASRSAALKSTKKRRVVGAESGVDVPSPLPQPPPKTTTRNRQIKVITTEIQIVQKLRKALYSTTPQNLTIIQFICGSIASFLPLLKCDGVARYLKWLVSRTGTLGYR